MRHSQTPRRSLKYIRLAAYFAAQPGDVGAVRMSIEEIEALLSLRLPDDARIPSWWKNDERRMHSRAWLAAGWEVDHVDIDAGEVLFKRSELSSEDVTSY